MALLAFLASADVRKYRSMIWAVLFGHVVSEIVVAAVLIWGDADRLVNFVLPILGDTLTFPISRILVG